jgi:hypothetical protein
MTENQKLAERIAKLLENEQRGELSSVFASLEKINHRLDKLESAAETQPSVQSIPTHPSQDKFSIAEAIADQIFAGVAKEKACTFEPNGKPCDHCSMCSSRGF